MCCLESEEIGRRITTDWQAAQVHVLPMMQLNFKVSLNIKNFFDLFLICQLQIMKCIFCCLRS